MAITSTVMSLLPGFIPRTTVPPQKTASLLAKGTWLALAVMECSNLYMGHVSTFKKEDKALAERGFTNKLEHYSLNTGGALNKNQTKIDTGRK